jgi:hypothetical protein
MKIQPDADYSLIYQGVNNDLLMIPAQQISNPPLRYLFVIAGFNPISSRVASADAASIFESNSPGRSVRRICCSIASRIVFCISTNGALPASMVSCESIPEACSWTRTLRCSGFVTPQFTYPSHTCRDRARRLFRRGKPDTIASASSSLISRSRALTKSSFVLKYVNRVPPAMPACFDISDVGVAVRPRSANTRWRRRGSHCACLRSWGEPLSSY